MDRKRYFRIAVVCTAESSRANENGINFVSCIQHWPLNLLIQLAHQSNDYYSFCRKKRIPIWNKRQWIFIQSFYLIKFNRPIQVNKKLITKTFLFFFVFIIIYDMHSQHFIHLYGLAVYTDYDNKNEKCSCELILWNSFTRSETSVLFLLSDVMWPAGLRNGIEKCRESMW